MSTASNRGSAHELFQEEPPTHFIRNGDTVHLWGCPHKGKKWVRWNWAEGKSLAQIAYECADWLMPCGHCRKKKEWA